MFCVSTSRVSHIKRVLIASSAAMMLAACSSDFERLSSYPDVGSTTASLPKQSASAGEVSSRTLDGGQPSTTRPSWQTGYRSSARSAATQPAPSQPNTVASSAVSSGTIVVQRGQTLYSIARANGMSPSRLASANNIPAPYSLRVGQRLVIPGVSNAVSPAPSFSPQVTATASPPAAGQNFTANGMHRVRAGETLFAIGRTYNVHPYKIAAHNNLAKPYSLSVGQQLRIPGASNTTATRLKEAEPETGNTYVPSQPVQAVNTTSKSSAGSQAVSAPVENVEKPIAKAQDSLSEDNGQFRWPVRGRIISKYGSKPGGTRNEGINISVPEGTSIRASEAGVVAYAGNELKGYGNLVLIRHEGGWVTAYAHNKELLVKRGDTVRRGEIVAKSGQTGSVTSPQLHFELRKGASAVDPLKHMSSSTASN